jgi:hypothetical protein
MSRIDREPQQHIHDNLVSEINVMIIRIKVSYESLGRKMEYPSTEEIVDLLTRIRDEIDQCNTSNQNSATGRKKLIIGKI